MVLYGAATGRDGIGGVSVLASATLEAGAEASRPSVQIGDPFAEKLLIEASLELIGEGLLEGLQDLGGAGISCALSESAARAGHGRGGGPRRRAAARGRHGALRDPDLGVPGADARDRPSLEAGGRAGAVRPMGVAHRGDRHAGRGRHASRSVIAATVVAEVPARSLADDGPEYDRPIAEPERADGADPALTPFDGDLGDALRAVLAAPGDRLQGVGVAAVRPHRPGQHGGGPRVRRRRDPRAELAEGRRRLERRQGPLRPPRPLPGRDARGGRVRAQRRGDRCPAARDHELPELRQPRAARGDVAVRRVDPRHPRRVRGARHARDRRQRELLQRERRQRDRSDAGDRHARAASRLPVARAERLPRPGPGRSISSARPPPSWAGPSSPRRSSAR